MKIVSIRLHETNVLFFLITFKWAGKFSDTQFQRHVKIELTSESGFTCILISNFFQLEKKSKNE